MRRPILVFLLAVLLPGLVLGGLALRSIRNQEAQLERERRRSLEDATERLARVIALRLDEVQRDFSLRVESLFGKADPREIARRFDPLIRERWPLATLGFVVSLEGRLFSPPVLTNSETRQFLLRNEVFLCQNGSVEVYAVTPKGRISLESPNSAPPAALPPPVPGPLPDPNPAASLADTADLANLLPTPGPGPGQVRFNQIVGDAQEGILSRFLDNQLVVWVWYRTPREADLVFGAQLSPAALRTDLARLVRDAPPPAPGVALALLDDRGLPLARTTAPPTARWNESLVERAIGPALPHWRVAAAIFDPASALHDQQRASLTLAAVVALLVVAMAIGGWLVVTDARRQLELARRKSDFVSNVSHELRTPLTSIRLFAELLSGDRVRDPEKRQRHLDVIQAESARLQRLIGNVLDFARQERGEVSLRLEPVDLADLAGRTFASFLPQFAAEDLVADSDLPATPVTVAGDADALAQLINNLLSNAVKYAASGREITLRLAPVREPGDTVSLEILDRGPGVPPGCEERIFEEFFRADDALTAGVPGAGLGLTLARRIARAHHGELVYLPRPGGGSCFRFNLPTLPA